MKRDRNREEWREAKYMLYADFWERITKVTDELNERKKKEEKWKKQSWTIQKQNKNSSGYT